MNIFIVVECLRCFHIVFGNAVQSHKYQHRMLVSLPLMIRFHKFIPLFQYICNLTKLKKHSTVKEL